jgi:Fe-S cluster assembly protein SufD
VSVVVAPEKATFQASLERLDAEAGLRQPAWLRARRARARQSYERIGFPSPRDESWRYTPVSVIAETPFRDRLEPEATPHGEPDPAELGLPAEIGARVVLVNGRLAPERSDPLPEGVRVASLRRAIDRHPGRLELLLGQVAQTDGNTFRALNTALLEDGVLVEIEPGRRVADPVHLVLVSAPPSPEPLALHPRVLIVVGRQSEATLVETHVGIEGRVYLSNVVTEVVLQDGARLDHYKLGLDSPAAFHLATLAVRQGRDSGFRSLAVTLGGALCRNDIETVFAAEGGECTLDGLFVGGGDQLLDTHTRIDHAHPRCVSRELYKGIMSGSSRGVFNGTILVRKDAQKTSAEQANRNLLLSPRALVNSVPQLLILADDVKCRHGSTTGQLDPEALFYLRSRGISLEQARHLLVHAFASEVLDRARVAPLREALSGLLSRQLPFQEPS